MKMTRFISVGMTILILFLCLFSILAYAEETLVFEGEFPEEKPLSEEDILKWIEQYVPPGVAELKELKKENPRVYEEELREFSYKIRDLEHVKRQDPQMFDRLVKADNLEVKSWQMAEEIGRAKDVEKKKQLIAELRKILEEIFDIRLEERMLEIKILEQELNEMKTMIETRKEKKAVIIDRHLKEMVHSEDMTLEWW